MNEFQLIRDIFAHTAQSHPQLVMGIGDDGAIWQPRIGYHSVFSVDTLVAGVHFDSSTPPHAIGWKSIAVNISDLAAMGAVPQAILLALSLPADLAQNRTWLSDFASGLFALCSEYHIALIGGDTTHSDVLSITITAIGELPTGTAITRSGACIGDVIAVSGPLGDAAAALHGEYPQLLTALHYPKPQVALGQALRGVASSLIDISDGFFQDLSHITKASGVGAVIELDQLPCSPTLQTVPLMTRLQWMLTGGDDYQLCFSLPELAAHQLQSQGFDIYICGHICSDPQITLRWQKEIFTPDFPLAGYQHFS